MKCCCCCSGLFFRFCLRLRQCSFHLIVSNGDISTISVLLLTFTRSYRSTLLITTPTTTPSLVKTSLKVLLLTFFITLVKFSFHDCLIDWLIDWMIDLWTVSGKWQWQEVTCFNTEKCRFKTEKESQKTCRKATGQHQQVWGPLFSWVW